MSSAYLICIFGLLIVAQLYHNDGGPSHILRLKVGNVVGDLHATFPSLTRRRMVQRLSLKTSLRTLSTKDTHGFSGVVVAYCRFTSSLLCYLVGHSCQMYTWQIFNNPSMPCPINLNEGQANSLDSLLLFANIYMPLCMCACCTSVCQEGVSLGVLLS